MHTRSAPSRNIAGPRCYLKSDQALAASLPSNATVYGSEDCPIAMSICHVSKGLVTDHTVTFYNEKNGEFVPSNTSTLVMLTRK